ncbi:Protein NUCLEAR FUSION DEFECTIVE 4-like [Quillaja saponaria]|uniref:Protein NUCLEAR FUSION DEFECTIVE 4-like n=1 Tax=Quillaja saponaria TaxID=32244 RepID=A0AAD7KTE7_QUISA|nr:Protein NUCLEAR FUSION DEFECTIVE 4-like [Quillaja saponaria]
MVQLPIKVKAFINNRWLVFVCAMWVQSCAGIGYLFGSISPVIKSSLGYNQRQVALLGVAKDLGDSIGFAAGSLCDVLPIWGLLLIGVIQNFVGYGLVWLIITHRLPTLPLWVMCIAIFVGTNGETYFNTASLVSGIQNFPKSRGPIVGILKGFAGLSGAILTQIYAMINASNQSSLIFMVAVGPSMVVIAFMFIIRPVGGHKQLRPSDNTSFLLTYSVCLLLAAYLMGVLLLEDLGDLNLTLVRLCSVILITIILLPIAIPIVLVFFSGPRLQTEEQLLGEPQQLEANKHQHDVNEVILSEVEDEKPAEVDSLPASERQKRISQLQAKLLQAAAEGAVRVKRRRGPHRGENFTLMQALVKADFWLMFFSLVLRCWVWSFGTFLVVLGVAISLRLSQGSFPIQDPATMAAVQVIMAFGFFYSFMGWPGEIYVITVLIGLGYGAHLAIVPASASELFGLKSFGALYNFLTLAIPTGSLIFSGLIASGIYDYYAEQQAAFQLQDLGTKSVIPLRKENSLSCEGSICYSLTFGILSGLNIVATVLSSILVYRTKTVYAHLYGKS